MKKKLENLISMVFSGVVLGIWPKDGCSFYNAFIKLDPLNLKLLLIENEKEIGSQIFRIYQFH